MPPELVDFMGPMGGGGAAGAIAYAVVKIVELKTGLPKLQAELEAIRQLHTSCEANVRALQADEFGNPAQLWLARGAQRWAEPQGAAGQSCQSCHGDAQQSMRGVATRYPSIDAKTGLLLNLEDRIRQSDDLLALSLHVSRASHGMPLRVDITGPAQSHWQQGQRLFLERQGQLNLSCAQCHDQHYGRRLYTDALSQGQPNSYPVYRLEWQSVGSLERRLRSCFVGVRAEPLAWGALESRQLSLYLMWRGEGLPLEVPAVRK